jgi:L-fucose isomerase-like protein
MPWATLGRLADDGFVCACEADLHGAVTLLALQWLAGAAPLLSDVVAMDDEADTLTLWHCGNAPACLARDGEEPMLITHCNRRIGVASNFAIRPGPTTLARRGVGPHGYRLLVAGGTAKLLDVLFAGGREHHVAVVHGNLTRELAALARLLGVEAVAV